MIHMDGKCAVCHKKIPNESTFFCNKCYNTYGYIYLATNLIEDCIGHALRMSE